MDLNSNFLEDIHFADELKSAAFVQQFFCPFSFFFSLQEKDGEKKVEIVSHSFGGVKKLFVCTYTKKKLVNIFGTTKNG